MMIFVGNILYGPEIFEFEFNPQIKWLKNSICDSFFYFGSR